MTQENKGANTEPMGDMDSEIGTNFEEFADLAPLLRSKGLEVPEFMEDALKKLDQIRRELSGFTGLKSPPQLLEELESRLPITEQSIVDKERPSVFEEIENHSIDAYEADIQHLENRVNRQAEDLFTKIQKVSNELIESKAYLNKWLKTNFSFTSSFNQEYTKRASLEQKLKESDKEIDKKKSLILDLDNSIKDTKNESHQLKKHLHKLREKSESLRSQLSLFPPENSDVTERYQNELKILNNMKHKMVLLNILSPIKNLWFANNAISFRFKNHEFVIQGLRCNDERSVTISPSLPKLQSVLQDRLNNTEVESLYDISVTVKEILSAHYLNFS